MSDGTKTTMDMHEEAVVQTLQSALAQIAILPRRMAIDAGDAPAHVPMLRGVWGAALHDLDEEAYRVVFRPQGEGSDDASPGYVFRPGTSDHRPCLALEWISIQPALAYDSVLMRAWDVASGMGLGPQRQRFHFREVSVVRPDESCSPVGEWAPCVEPLAWTLAEARWPLKDPGVAPCRLEFVTPVRLRRQGRLIETPTFSDVVVAAVRRIRAYLPEASLTSWDLLGRNLLALSREVPCLPWRGLRFDLRRYSGSQRVELELQAVAGYLDLPAGPGPLWPLLSALQWLHVGKSTILGLGQLRIRPLSHEHDASRG